MNNQPHSNTESAEQTLNTLETLRALDVMPDVNVVGTIAPEPDKRLPGIVFIAPTKPIGFRDDQQQNALARRIRLETGLQGGHDTEWHTGDALFDNTNGTLHLAALQDGATGTSVRLYPAEPLAEAAYQDEQRYRLANKHGLSRNPHSPMTFRLREADAPERYDVRYTGYGSFTRARKRLAESALSFVRNF